MSKIYDILAKISSKSGKRLELIELAKKVMAEYKEPDLVVTPASRCEILIKILNVTNPDTCQDELTYIENAILFDKGLLKSLESLNHYADCEIHTSKTSTSVNVLVDWISVIDSTNLLKNLIELVNELIFSLEINVEISLIIHQITTSVETVDVAASINQTRIIEVR